MTSGHGRPVLPETVLVAGGMPLGGELRVPGDKSISHRALIVGALGEGTSLLRGLSDGDDVRRTRDAVAALGAEVHDDGEVVTVTGGRSLLHAPLGPLDCGNSGTSMRLLAGVAAGLAGVTVLAGDASLSARPMDRVAAPLRAMGATVTGNGPRCLPPLAVTGGSLEGITWTPEVASAQVKSAVLLAGLFAAGETAVRERVRTRPHTEELLALAGADIEVTDEGAGRTVRVRASSLRPFDVVVPGDPSQAAFWVVAACVVPKSALRVRGVYAGETRTGFLSVLRRMGARVGLDGGAPGPAGAAANGRGAVAAGSSVGAVADVTAQWGPLSATVVDASEIPSLDEVPVLAVAAACAEGTTRFVGMGELRVKESDRLRAVARLVSAVGAVARIEGEDLVVEGVGDAGGTGGAGGVGGASGLHHFRFDSEGDHRMAMAAAVAALAAGPGESRIDGFGGVATSYPAFLAHLRHVGGHARVQLVAIDGPAGSGKSTVSRAIAERLGLDRLDTGAMYRAVAWAALERGIDPEDAPGVAELAHEAVIDPGPPDVVIDGVVVTSAIRTPEVNRAVSAVAANPSVRAALVERQRAWAVAHGGGVVEGRDIGTVVFPHADLKVFLTAAPEERARRRREEPSEGVALRDQLDITRTASPLVQAADARLVDTTCRSVDEVIAEILSWLR
ncbi:MAG: 3-phosphoshikimate 1-carboxyvinyltransferase [Actinomycetota bacterium]|nr:3-phosphoshikimate 1-carboxyvinyltransferase [Actinomycetota bacterium]